MATVNQAVRQHQVEIDWEYQEVVRRCWGYYDRFRQAFFPDLPDCFLRCEPGNARQKLGYHRGDNGVGAQFELTLNTHFLGLPRYQVAALILHGMIHMWQEVSGHPAANAYHNREFQERSGQLGIPCKRGRGCDVVGWEAPFRTLVMEVDADAFQPMLSDRRVPEGGASPLKKWSCGCTNIRAAVEVNAVCLICGQPFVRQG